MKDQKLKVIYNNKVGKDVYLMSLAGDCREIERPGQFIDILVDDFFLRRPISILDSDDEHVEILYRVVGSGTFAMAEKKAGDMLDALLPLGNGFDISKCHGKTLLVAGGIGMPPIYGLSKLMASDGMDFRTVIGYRSEDDMFLMDRFKELGIDPVIATEDGSFGIKGLVTDAMDHLRAEGYDFDYVMCCGPEPMLKAVYEHSPDGQFSFEARMGCGFGACMGCSRETKYGSKRICKDGPVLDMDEIVW